MKTYWISKYVLSRGVYPVEAELRRTDSLSIEMPSHGRWPLYFHKGEWYETEEEAKKDARVRLLKRLQQLEVQKQKTLKKLDQY